jgi:hypothetical protein
MTTGLRGRKFGVARVQLGEIIPRPQIARVKASILRCVPHLGRQLKDDEGFTADDPLKPCEKPDTPADAPMGESCDRHAGTRCADGSTWKPPAETTRTLRTFPATGRLHDGLR